MPKHEGTPDVNVRATSAFSFSFIRTTRLMVQMSRVEFPKCDLISTGVLPTQMSFHTSCAKVQGLRSSRTSGVDGDAHPITGSGSIAIFTVPDYVQRLRLCCASRRALRLSFAGRRILGAKSHLFIRSFVWVRGMIENLSVCLFVIICNPAYAEANFQFYLFRFSLIRSISRLTEWTRICLCTTGG